MKLPVKYQVSDFSILPVHGVKLNLVVNYWAMIMAQFGELSAQKELFNDCTAKGPLGKTSKHYSKAIELS